MRLHEVQRQAIITVLRNMPRATLAEICAFCERGGDRAAQLGAVTIHELITPPTLTAGDAGPYSDGVRLNRAKRCNREAFDALVYEVLVEAAGPVGASYLRARVGGPRWKLQGSLGRLAEAGKVTRRGVTSTTRYSATSGAL